MSFKNQALLEELDTSSFEELEYKYRADEIKFSDFQQLMFQLPILKAVSPGSWDIYYTQDSVEGSFQRLRLDLEKPELTKKVKTNKGNNWVRLESDLPLDPARTTEAIVAFHLSLDSYRENFRIFKSCAIFFEENLNFVYYVVYDNNMQELDRFIEVEVNKARVPILEALEPGLSMQELRRGEILLASLGLTAQNRLKKSLFELYRKRK